MHKAIRKDDIDTLKLYHDLSSQKGLLVCAASNGSVRCLRLLLDIGVPSNETESLMRWSPLHWAAAKGNEECCRVLIGQGEANIESLSRDGATPLHVAIANGKRSGPISR